MCHTDIIAHYPCEVILHFLQPLSALHIDASLLPLSRECTRISWWVPPPPYPTLHLPACIVPGWCGLLGLGLVAAMATGVGFSRFPSYSFWLTRSKVTADSMAFSWTVVCCLPCSILLHSIFPTLRPHWIPWLCGTDFIDELANWSKKLVSKHIPLMELCFHHCPKVKSTLAYTRPALGPNCNDTNAMQFFFIMEMNHMGTEL